MTEPIQDMLSQLNAMVVAQLTAANDRATTAEMNFTRLRDGLSALVGVGQQAEMPEPKASIISASETAAKVKSVNGGACHARISDEELVAALSPTWQGAHAVRKALLAKNIRVAYGTIYSRLSKIAAASATSLILSGCILRGCHRLRRGESYGSSS